MSRIEKSIEIYRHAQSVELNMKTLRYNLECICGIVKLCEGLDPTEQVQNPSPMLEVPQRLSSMADEISTEIKTYRSVIERGLEEYAKENKGQIIETTIN